jgi:hypothetical protein
MSLKDGVKEGLGFAAVGTCGSYPLIVIFAPVLIPFFTLLLIGFVFGGLFLDGR